VSGRLRCGRNNGEELEHQAFRNDATRGWRVLLRLRQKRNDQTVVEMRVGLRGGGKNISATWSYLLPR